MHFALCRGIGTFCATQSLGLATFFAGVVQSGSSFGVLRGSQQAFGGDVQVRAKVQEESGSGGMMVCGWLKIG